LYRSVTAPPSSTFTYSPSITPLRSVWRTARSTSQPARSTSARNRAGASGVMKCDFPTSARSASSPGNSPAYSTFTGTTGSPASSAARRGVSRNAPVSVSRMSNSMK